MASSVLRAAAGGGAAGWRGRRSGRAGGASAGGRCVRPARREGSAQAAARPQAPADRCRRRQRRRGGPRSFAFCPRRCSQPRPPPHLRGAMVTVTASLRAGCLLWRPQRGGRGPCASQLLPLRVGVHLPRSFAAGRRRIPSCAGVPMKRAQQWVAVAGPPRACARRGGLWSKGGDGAAPPRRAARRHSAGGPAAPLAAGGHSSPRRGHAQRAR